MLIELIRSKTLLLQDSEDICAYYLVSSIDFSGIFFEDGVPQLSLLFLLSLPPSSPSLPPLQGPTDFPLAHFQ